ncbi:MAG: transcription antitermination factor NusB [Bacteroidales bacterium]|nr:transcription antitermination factor NusB [Candidatus Cacconaster merdequi]
MISRRLIRIKAFKTLFAYENSGCTELESARKNLVESCDKVKELYYFLLNISSSLVDVASEKIAAGMGKFHPTEQEANPNMKFVRNKFAELLASDPEFGRFCSKHGLGWGENDAFVKRVYASMVTKDYYRNYMASEDDSFAADCDLFSCIFQDEFEDNEELLSILEDMSIFWIDDVAYALNVIIAGIEETKRSHRIKHPSSFLKEDDKEFALRLLGDAILNYDEYIELISDNLSNWKSERLVPTDAALIVLGITEAVSFPTIPVKVTINEYVEISKYYSTPNSRIFVNGILDKIIQEKMAQGEVRKQGRGLLG